ncbi:MAG: hypothetical protein M1814_006156 [Vezdaea aestivalis]|nr:MAG: hypothetical protein M1814_006156 [Vezdaea aestivalis]
MKLPSAPTQLTIALLCLYACTEAIPAQSTDLHLSRLTHRAVISRRDDSECMSHAERMKLQYSGGHQVDAYLAESGSYRARWTKDFMKACDLHRGQTVLDLATGTGVIALEAAKVVGRRGQVIGVDISEDMIERARQFAAQSRGVTRFIVDSFENLDLIPELRGRKFDVITCGSGLKYAEDQAETLKNWAKHLKPGGKIVFDIQYQDGLQPIYAADYAAVKLGVPVLNFEGEFPTVYTISKRASYAGLEASLHKSPVYLEGTLHFKKVASKATDRLNDPFYQCHHSPEFEDETNRMFQRLLGGYRNGEEEIKSSLWYYFVVARARDEL